MEKDIWERVYFTDSGENPFLFYVLFGTDKIEELSVSKTKHNIDGMPEELEIINYNKSGSDEQKNYIEGFYNENLGMFLKEKDSDLYEKVINCNNITVIRGEFKDNNSLNYLKNTIGIIQAIIDTNITAILDLQTFGWSEPEEWSKMYFEPKSPCVFSHVKKLYSKDNDGMWLHTRGMRKFGRPDLSIRKITENKKEIAIEIVNRFTQAFAFGLLPDETKEIKLKNMEKGTYGKIMGGYDDWDFNNYYFEIEHI